MASIIFPNDGHVPSSSQVSISSDLGVFHFNKGALKQFELNKYKYCLLYYDADENKIEIQLSNDEKNSAIIKLRHNIYGSEITSKTFFKYFNIFIPGRLIYNIDKGANLDFLIINLNKKINKSKKRQHKL